MNATSSNIALLIHHQLALTTGERVAAAIQSVETHISKFRAGERGIRIDQVGPFFGAIGLKLVPADEVTVDPKYLEALRTMAARGI